MSSPQDEKELLDANVTQLLDAYKHVQSSEFVSCRDEQTPSLGDGGEEKQCDVRIGYRKASPAILKALRVLADAVSKKSFVAALCGDKNHRPPKVLRRASPGQLTRLLSSVIQMAIWVELAGLDQCTVSFNGGKDCTVVLFLLHYAISLIDVVLQTLTEGEEQSSGGKLDFSAVNVLYLTSSSEFPAVLNFMEAVKNALNYRSVPVTGSSPNTLREVIEKHTMRVVFMGQRRTDPKAPDDGSVARTSAGWPDFIRVNPVFEWPYEDVWWFLLQFQVPFCRLYREGYTSLGSTKNTKPNPLLLRKKCLFHTEQPCPSLKDDDLAFVDTLEPNTMRNEAKSPSSSTQLGTVERKLCGAIRGVLKPFGLARLKHGSSGVSFEEPQGLKDCSIVEYYLPAWYLTVDSEERRGRD